MNRHLRFFELFGDIDDSMIYEASLPWRNNRPKYSGIFLKIAAVFMVIFLGFSCIFYADVKAALENISSIIGKFLGIEADLSPYTEIKNLTVSKNGIPLTLKEVILDDEELIFSLELEDSGNEEYTVISTAWINNRQLQRKRINAVEESLDHPTRNYLIGYYYGKELSLEHDTAEIHLEIKLQNLDGKEIGIYPFDFTTSKKELESSTKEIPLDSTIPLDKTHTLTLTEFRWNTVDSSIKIYSEDLLLDANYYLIGEDDKGNPVRYQLMDFENPDGVFTLDYGFSISPEAESLKLQLYVSDLSGLSAETSQKDEDSDYGEELVYGDEENSRLRKVGEKISLFLDIPLEPTYN